MLQLKLPFCECRRSDLILDEEERRGKLHAYVRPAIVSQLELALGILHRFFALEVPEPINKCLCELKDPVPTAGITQPCNDSIVRFFLELYIQLRFVTTYNG